MDRTRILSLLARHKQRATYSAVAGCVGVEPRALMADLPRQPAYSWVVNAKTGMPTGYRVQDLDPALLDSDRVIASAAELSEWVQTHQPSRGSTMSPTIHFSGKSIAVGPLTLTIHRTLRLPNDGQRHALPPSLGTFPLKRVDDYADKVPASWREHGGVFFPMWQREAAWLAFHVADEYDPVAVKVAAGKVCAVTGEQWSDVLRGSPQNYMVVGKNGYGTGQPWIDGFKTGAGEVSQFVAMPLGMGYTVEKQVTGKEDHGGLQVAVFRCKPTHLPPRPSRLLRSMAISGQSIGGDVYGCSSLPISSSIDVLARAGDAGSYAMEMGLAAGGKMHQEIYPDKMGIDSWVPTPDGRVFIHIVNSQMYEAITGEKAPPTPISARDYTSRGWQWFDLWDKEDVPVQAALSGIKNVAQIDAEKGISKQQDDTFVNVPPEQVKKLGDPSAVRDGKW